LEKSYFSSHPILLIPSYRHTAIEEALQALDWADLIIKIAPIKVVNKWLVRSRRRSCARFAEEDLHRYATEVYDNAGYQATALKRGVKIIRMEASRVMGTTKRHYLFHLFKAEIKIQPDYAEKLFDVQRIFRDCRDNELELCSRLYRRPSYAFQEFPSLAACILELDELPEGKERPGREDRRRLMERKLRIDADDPLLLYCAPAIERTPKPSPTTSTPIVAAFSATVASTASSPETYSSQLAEPTSNHSAASSAAETIAPTLATFATPLVSPFPDRASAGALPTPHVLSYLNSPTSEAMAEGISTALRLASLINKGSPSQQLELARAFREQLNPHALMAVRTEMGVPNLEEISFESLEKRVRGDVEHLVRVMKEQAEDVRKQNGGARGVVGLVNPKTATLPEYNADADYKLKESAAPFLVALLRSSIASSSFDKETERLERWVSMVETLVATSPSMVLRL
jgi:hypothetical protein